MINNKKECFFQSNPRMCVFISCCYSCDLYSITLIHKLKIFWRRVCAAKMKFPGQCFEKLEREQDTHTETLPRTEVIVTESRIVALQATRKLPCFRRLGGRSTHPGYIGRCSRDWRRRWSVVHATLDSCPLHTLTLSYCLYERRVRLIKAATETTHVALTRHLSKIEKRNCARRSRVILRCSLRSTDALQWSYVLETFTTFSWELHCVRKKVTPCVLFYNSGK